MIRIVINGAPHEVPADTTLAALVTLVGAHPEGVAVALDGEVVPRAELGRRGVAPGAKVEIIRAVGGG